MLAHWRLQTHFPIKRLYCKLETSIQTYINYHKTHTMAMHYGGVGDTSMENPENRDLDNDSQDNFQDENIVQQLICKTEWLRQAIEDRDSDPRDATHQLEQRLNRLTLTLCPPSEPIEDILDKYTETLCTTQKKNISRKLFVTRYSHIKWARLFTAWGLAHRHWDSLRIDRWE